MVLVLPLNMKNRIAKYEINPLKSGKINESLIIETNFTSSITIINFYKLYLMDVR